MSPILATMSLHTHQALDKAFSLKLCRKLYFPFLNPLAGFVLVLAGNRRHTQEGQTHTDLGKVRRICGNGEAHGYSTVRAATPPDLKGKERRGCYWIQ